MQAKSSKFHRCSIRLKKYDYSQKGAYFITICTFNRDCLFGKIINDKVFLNDFGNIAKKEIEKTSEIRKNIQIDCFIIMPNHVHVIIIIDDDSLFCKDTMHRVPTFE